MWTQADLTYWGGGGYILCTLCKQSFKELRKSLTAGFKFFTIPIKRWNKYFCSNCCSPIISTTKTTFRNKLSTNKEWYNTFAHTSSHFLQNSTCFCKYVTWITFNLWLLPVSHIFFILSIIDGLIYRLSNRCHGRVSH